MPAVEKKRPFRTGWPCDSIERHTSEGKMHYGTTAIFLVVGSKIGMPQTPVEPETNIASVEKLQMPTFPPKARVARVQGIINTTVLLSQQGSAQTINTGKGHPVHSLCRRGHPGGNVPC